VEASLLCIDCAGRGGVNGEELVERLVATLMVRVLVLGEGVRGMRPPAVLDEKRP
jgi:hypothetical protein